MRFSGISGGICFQGKENISRLPSKPSASSVLQGYQNPGVTNTTRPAQRVSSRYDHRNSDNSPGESAAAAAKAAASAAASAAATEQCTSASHPAIEQQLGKAESAASRDNAALASSAKAGQISNAVPLAMWSKVHAAHGPHGQFKERRTDMNSAQDQPSSAAAQAGHQGFWGALAQVAAAAASVSAPAGASQSAAAGHAGYSGDMPAVVAPAKEATHAAAAAYAERLGNTADAFEDESSDDRARASASVAPQSRSHLYQPGPLGKQARGQMAHLDTRNHPPVNGHHQHGIPSGRLQREPSDRQVGSRYQQIGSFHTNHPRGPSEERPAALEQPPLEQHAHSRSHPGANSAHARGQSARPDTLKQPPPSRHAQSRSQAGADLGCVHSEPTREKNDFRAESQSLADNMHGRRLSGTDGLLPRDVSNLSGTASKQRLGHRTSSRRAATHRSGHSSHQPRSRARSVMSMRSNAVSLPGTTKRAKVSQSRTTTKDVHGFVKGIELDVL